MFNIRTLTTKFRIGYFLIGRRSLSSPVRSFKEVSIKVPWGHIAGKWWGPYDTRPVLSLHGWQDNCATFDRLLPLLNRDVGFLAIDLPGHGYSSRLPHGLMYHLTNSVILIHYLVKYFQWPKISLMGHSLGGITCYIYSMIYPDTVDFLVCIDGAKPLIISTNETIAKSIDEFLKYSDHAESIAEPDSYTLEEIRHKISTANHNSIMYEYADILIERNIAESKLQPGKYYFTRDPRIKAVRGSLLNFPQDDLICSAQNMVMPIFISKAKSGPYYEAKENFYEVLDVLKRSSIDCDFHYVEGTHHAVLNNPEEVACLIKKFIQKHNIEDRSIGGIRDEIIVENRTPLLNIN